MRSTIRIFVAFLTLFLLTGHGSSPLGAQQICHFKTVPVKSTKCDRGLKYVGPSNAIRFGGYCLLPLNCKINVSNSKSASCAGNSIYVGADNAAQVGGQCISAPGWQITVRRVNSVSACQYPERYLGPAKPSRLGGHCVKISK